MPLGSLGALPVLAMLDAVNERSADAVFRSDVLRYARVFSNRANLLHGKLGQRVCLRMARRGFRPASFSRHVGKVFPMAPKPQMSGVYATRVVARMAYKQPAWYLAPGTLYGKTMCANGPPPVAENTVSIRSFVSLPFPASVAFGHHRPKFLNAISLDRLDQAGCVARDAAKLACGLAPAPRMEIAAASLTDDRHRHIPLGAARAARVDSTVLSPSLIVSPTPTARFGGFQAPGDGAFLGDFHDGRLAEMVAHNQNIPCGWRP